MVITNAKYNKIMKELNGQFSKIDSLNEGYFKSATIHADGTIAKKAKDVEGFYHAMLNCDSYVIKTENGNPVIVFIFAVKG